MDIVFSYHKPYSLVLICICQLVIKRKKDNKLYFYLCFPMLHVFMHIDLSCQYYSLFISAAHYMLCCKNVSPHLLFKWFLRADVPPSVLSSSFTSIFLHKQQIAFGLPFRLKEKEIFTITDVYFSLCTLRVLAKIYKEMCILPFSFSPASLMS